MFRRWVIALLAVPTICLPAFAESFTVTIKAVNADNRPVANAEAALFWRVQAGAIKPSVDKPFVTDGAGKAILTVDDWKEKRPVLILSADRGLGGIIGVGKDDEGKELAVRLEPTVRVKGKLVCKELKIKPEQANTMVSVEGLRPPFAQHMTEDASVELVLPVGKYQFRTSGADVESVTQTVSLTSDRKELDLGTIDMKATTLAKLKGKAAPEWTIGDAHGVKADAKLADAKGKWVYLEFWGFW
jgi:hypothetical protein